jgi:DNA-binding winged helix-turn-helix (wHTH) protein
LTAKEFAVLEYLMRNAGTIISATELIDHAWDSNYEGFSNVVQTYIRYLRQKLTLPGETEIVETRRGAGTDLKRTYQVVDLNELIRLDIDARASNPVEAARLDIHRGQATVVLGSPALLARAIANII